MIVYVLVFFMLFLWYRLWRYKNRHMYKHAEKIPGYSGVTLLWKLLYTLYMKPHEIFRTVIEESFNFGNVAKLWFGPFLAVVLLDPRDIELVLTSQVHLEKSDEYDYFKPWLGNGLLISNGQKWRSHRKLIAPAFHLNVLRSFIELFNENSRQVVEKLKREGNKEFDCHDYMAEATVEILLETAMGVSKKTQGKSGYDYAMAVMKMCEILYNRHIKIWLRPDFIFRFTKYSKTQTEMLDTIHNLTRNVIKKKKDNYKDPKSILEEVNNTTKINTNTNTNLDENSLDRNFNEEQNIRLNNTTKVKTVVEGLSFGQSAGLKDDLDVDDDDVGEKKRMAFLDLLIEASQNGVVINDEEIKEQVDTIMFEGHDTTAAGSSFFLSMMGVHQEIQERVVQELDEIFSGSDRPATFADTLEMKYLERCLMETLRMYPPVPVIARKIKHDLKLASCDLTVPAGSTVGIGIFKVHRLPEIYNNPDKFDPDNFLPEKTSNRHYYSFIPFSAGPRSCVGRKYAMLKLKILLSTILRNYRIFSDLKEKDFQLRGDIILKRAEGFRIRMEPRSKMSA